MIPHVDSGMLSDVSLMAALTLGSHMWRRSRATAVCFPSNGL